MNSQDSSHSLRLAFVSAKLGVPSTVWMYRQLIGLGDEVRQAFTWQHLSPELFPIESSKLTLIPKLYEKPLEGWKRRLDSLVCPQYGGPRHGAGYSWWLSRQFKKHNINAALCQFGPCAMAVERACRGTGVGVFAHFHGHDITAALKNQRYRKGLENHWQSFAGIIVVAKYQRDWFVERGYDAASIALIPCGAPSKQIDQQVSAIRRSESNSSSPTQGCRFLFVGRFVEKKDPLSVLKAFEQCWLRHRHSTLVMAGYGTLETACKDWLVGKSDSLKAAISFPGQLTPAQVIQAMAQSDVYVQHSRTPENGDKEGWPVTIAEAMAAGLPIVATRHAGIVDQVVENHNGYLCDEGDWTTMGDGMSQLASDVMRRREFGQRSRELAMHFEYTLQIEKLRMFMHQCLLGKNQSARSGFKTS